MVDLEIPKRIITQRNLKYVSLLNFVQRLSFQVFWSVSVSEVATQILRGNFSYEHTALILEHQKLGRTSPR
jgi:hypothetical protein